MGVTVTKASGQTEPFDSRKLVESLVRSGAASDVALDIAAQVELLIKPGSHTRHIYKLAKRLLKQYNRTSSMRYSIKKAISDLGPSGYPFEKYFGRILRAYGYEVELNRIIRGYCVMHEVDVLAKKDNEYTFIECKYHSDHGKPTDVKIAMYVHARFQDIARGHEKNPGQTVRVHHGWLVTNTRCTTDAIAYAKCTGLRIVSWRYPEEMSLEKMIEGRKLYPVTVLSPITKSTLETLLDKDIILAQDIVNLSEEALAKSSSLDLPTVRTLKRQAAELCL